MSVSSFGTFAAFHNRRFALLWAGALVSSIGSWMERIAVGVYVTELTGKSGWTGTVSAMLFIPVALVGPLGGVIADRMERRSYLMGLSAIQALIAAVVSYMAYSKHLGIPALMILMFLTGCANVFNSAAFNGLLATTVEGPLLTSALFLSSGQWNMARVIGPLLAAPFMIWGGVAWVFAFNAMSFLAVMTAVATFKPIPPQPQETTVRAFVREFNQGVRTATHDPGTLSAIQMAALSGFLIAPFIGLIPAFAYKAFGGGATDAAWLTALQGFGAVCCAAVAGVMLPRVGHGRWLRVASQTLGMLTIFFWWTRSAPFAMVLMFFLGAGYLAVNTGLHALVMLRAPIGSHSRISSLYSAVLDGAYACGVATVGWFGDLWSLRWAGSIGAAVFLMVVWSLIAFRPKFFNAMTPVNAG